MEILYKWLIEHSGTLGVFVTAVVMFVVWLWRDASDKRAAREKNADTYDRLLSKALETIEDDTRAIDAMRSADHEWQIKLAEGLAHLTTLIEERLPRRGVR